MTSSYITIPVAKTSLWIAAERYRETQRPDRLINGFVTPFLLAYCTRSLRRGVNRQRRHTNGGVYEIDNASN